MDSLEGRPKFHVADYAIFGLLMGLSAGIGIYFALTGGRQRTTSEYILGNRRMKIAPVALSLIVSFESSIMMLGFPAEMYAYGVQFWTMHIGLFVCISFICLAIVPLIHPLKITSVYEYLEKRYGSPIVRRLGSLLGILNYVWYIAVVFYGPATALESGFVYMEPFIGNNNVIKSSDIPDVTSIYNHYLFGLLCSISKGGVDANITRVYLQKHPLCICVNGAGVVQLVYDGILNNRMDSLEGRPKFHVADYAIFGLLMGLSAGIGIYFALTGGRQRTTSEYILGNRRMKIAPVALSLIVSFESSIMMLGFPAEMYAYGVQFWTMHIGLFVCISFICLAIVPLIHPLKITSVYEYLEKRYGSPIVRRLGSLLGILNYVWYIAVVFYGPATALESDVVHNDASIGRLTVKAVEVADFPVWYSVIIVSIGAIFYTTIGGFKAVVWTDAIQFVIMACGIVTIIIFGCIRVGGINKVFEINEKGGRMHFFDFNVDPTTRHTFWNLVLAGMIRPVYLGLNQASVQRMSSMKTLRSAQIMMMLSYPGFLLFGTLACLQGLIAYANFAEFKCDPFGAKLISNTNQVLPYFVMDLFRNMPGLPGLFLASLFSASLSTLSSGLNSLSTLFWTDFLKPHFHNMSDFKATLIVKLLVVIFGVLGTGLALLVLNLEGPLTQIAGGIFGSVNGPLVGLFLLGAFFPSATTKGAVLGASVTIAIVLWLTLGSFLSPETKQTPYLPPASINGCFPISYNNSNFVTPLDNSINVNPTALNETTESPAPYGSQISGLAYFYSISYQWFSIIGMFGTVIMGLIFSHVTGANKPGDVNPKYIIPVIDHLFCYLPKCAKAQRKGEDERTELPDADDTLL